MAGWGFGGRPPSSFQVKNKPRKSSFLSVGPRGGPGGAAPQRKRSVTFGEQDKCVIMEELNKEKEEADEADADDQEVEKIGGAAKEGDEDDDDEDEDDSGLVVVRPPTPPGKRRRSFSLTRLS